MRAILLASATATSLKGFLSISFFAHIRSGSVCGLVETAPHGRPDQRFAQIAIAHLRNAPLLWLAARGVLLGRQSEKGGELARAGEPGCILNGGRHRRVWLYFRFPLSLRMVEEMLHS